MTDAEKEAEAAMLALGRHLNWVCRGRAVTGKTREEREYHVDREMGQFAAVLITPGEEGRICPDIESDGGYYKSPQEAQAACERHYATGKWE